MGMILETAIWSGSDGWWLTRPPHTRRKSTRLSSVSCWKPRTLSRRYFAPHPDPPPLTHTLAVLGSDGTEYQVALPPAAFVALIVGGGGRVRPDATLFGVCCSGY